MKRPARRIRFRPPDARKIGARIKVWRKRAGWSMADLVQVTGIPPGTLSAYESGHRVPVRDNVLRLGLALCASVEQVLYGRRAPQGRG